jgi:hypothetical protein
LTKTTRAPDGAGFPETAPTIEIAGTGMFLDEFSGHIAYVDESGDHGLAPLDVQYPIFVLALCVCSKPPYLRQLVPAFKSLKFQQFGHDMVVLHEHAIRKRLGPFSFNDVGRRVRFVEDLTSVIADGEFCIIASAIDKARWASQTTAGNPYHLALGLCLEALYELMLERREADPVTHVVVECRGPKEDRELATAFEAICAGANRWGKVLPFAIVFAHKQSNSTGLQLADLVARPIGLSVLRPGRENRAFDVLRHKIHRLIVFPGSENKRPR